MKRLSSKFIARFHLIVALSTGPVAEDVARRVPLEEGDARDVTVLHDLKNDVLIAVAKRRAEQV